jgi:hypothetical protein
MKCEECRQVLEDYVDGELNAARRAAINTHLGACVECAGAETELRQFTELYARYERDIEVTPALWASVAARIKLEQPPRPASSRLSDWFAQLVPHFTAPRFSPALAAALVVVAIGVTIAVMSVLQSRTGSPNNGQPTVATSRPDANNSNETKDSGGQVAVTPPTTNPVPENNANNPGVSKPASEPTPRKPIAPKQVVAGTERKPVDPQQLIREAEQKYVAAIAILSRDVSRRRSEIDPVVLARFDNALADIDRTIKETKRVVREHPNDPVALNYLLSAYAQKVDTLREMSMD